MKIDQQPGGGWEGIQDLFDGGDIIEVAAHHDKGVIYMLQHRTTSLPSRRMVKSANAASDLDHPSEDICNEDEEIGGEGSLGISRGRTRTSS